MGTVDEESAAKFINALIKSVQTLCHGYLDFDTGVEIIGHINLSVDKVGSLDYILKEKVCKNDENSTLFISNSFHAQPKPEQPAKSKNTDAQVLQRRHSSDNSESGKLSSAISSISSALSSSKDTAASSGTRPQSTTKRKAHDDFNEQRPSKTSSHDSHFLSSHSQSSPNDTRSSSPVDSKASLSAVTAGFEGSPRTSNEDVHGAATLLPQTASVTSDNQSDLDVNLAGSVLERVDDHSNSEMPEKDDSDLDLEVTFIKEEFVEGEKSSCEFQGSGGQQYSRVSHQRDNVGEQTLFPVALHSNASATYVPGSQDMMGLAQHFPPGAMGGPSTSQPQPGTSGMRGLHGSPSVASLSPFGSLSALGLPIGQSFCSSVKRDSPLAGNREQALIPSRVKELQQVPHRMYTSVEKEQLLASCLGNLSDHDRNLGERHFMQREKRRVMKRKYRAALPEAKKSEIRFKDAERKRMKRATGGKSSPRFLEDALLGFSFPSVPAESAGSSLESHSQQNQT